MEIAITLPDDVATALRRRWADIPRRALEALVADGYREGVITGPQAQQILGLSSRLELESFLRRAAVPLDYSVEDLRADAQTLDRFLGG